MTPLLNAPRWVLIGLVVIAAIGVVVWTSSPSERTARSPRGAVVTVDTPSQEPHSALSAGELERAAPGKAKQETSPPRPARDTPPLPPDPVREAEIVARARARLAERDGPGALAILEEAGGSLSSEVLTARAEALVKAGRPAEALPLLEAVDLDRIGDRRHEIWMMRAELRLSFGRHDAAMEDFGQILASRAPADVQERALYSRAVGRAREGDREGARADYEQYLQRFPSGRFVAEARRAVDAP